jgi:hypothetical protein
MFRINQDPGALTAHVMPALTNIEEQYKALKAIDDVAKRNIKRGALDTLVTKTTLSTSTNPNINALKGGIKNEILIKRRKANWFYTLRRLAKAIKDKDEPLPMIPQQDDVNQRDQTAITPYHEPLNTVARYAAIAHDAAGDLNYFDQEVDLYYPEYSDEPVTKKTNKKMKKAYRDNLPVYPIPPSVIPINPAPIILSHTASQTQTQEISTSTDDLEKAIANDEARLADTTTYEQENYFTIRDKLMAKMKILNIPMKLTYYLKCKYAFALRTPSLLIQMRADARVWLAKNDYSMENDQDFRMMTTSILAAYMIDREELSSIALLSDRTMWNNTYDFNRALSGEVDLQIKSFLLGGKPWRGHTRGLLFNKTTTTNLPNKPII